MQKIVPLEKMGLVDGLKILTRVITVDLVLSDNSTRKDVITENANGMVVFNCCGGAGGGCSKWLDPDC